MPTPPSPLVVASILAGVPAALWAYKCAMMVLFQRKIIYMGYAPLGARTDRLADIPRSYLHGMTCSELRVQSSNKPISALLVRPSSPSIPAPEPDVDTRLVVLYLQGNAGNPLHRLPVFQSLLAASPVNPSILAPAPRSYWTSPGRPTQPGILSDYTLALTHALRRFPRAHVVLYGHSLGGAVALCLLAQPSLSEILGKDAERIRGVILENPFASVPAMVEALYPQKWLPYRYLTPFVWDRWDALGAVRQLGDVEEDTTLLGRLRRRILVLTSENDEVVPKEMGAAIVHAAMGKPFSENGTGREKVNETRRTRGRTKERGQHESLCTRLVVVRGALHEDAWKRKEWAEAVSAYMHSVMAEANDSSSSASPDMKAKSV
ncbi:hypothetical protein C0995_015330 [Termitomyces sp. Mi166|nr:hypothetical protein C0995_015330 [Termitomyces sp. Mi166\